MLATLTQSQIWLYALAVRNISAEVCLDP
jgi:hypothetical protein